MSASAILERPATPALENFQIPVSRFDIECDICGKKITSNVKMNPYQGVKVNTIQRVACDYFIHYFHTGCMEHIRTNHKVNEKRKHSELNHDKCSICAEKIKRIDYLKF